MVLPLNNDIFISGYCLAESKKDADETVIWSQSKKKSFDPKKDNSTLTLPILKVN